MSLKTLVTMYFLIGWTPLTFSQNNFFFFLKGNMSLVLRPDLYDFDLVPFLTESRTGRNSPLVEEVVKFFYTFPRYPGQNYQTLLGV